LKSSLRSDLGWNSSYSKRRASAVPTSNKFVPAGSAVIPANLRRQSRRKSEDVCFASHFMPQLLATVADAAGYEFSSAR